MKTLTKQESKKILKAQQLITEALFLLNNVDSTNSEFRYASNRNILFNTVDSAKSILDDITNEIINN